MVLVLSFALVAGTLLFIEIAGLVRDGTTEQIDKTLLLAFRNPNNTAEGIGPRSIQEAVRDMTALGSMATLCLISALVGGFFLLTRKYAAFLLLSAALGGGLLLNKLLKFYYNRPRPADVTPLQYVDSYSFPSGHALLSTVIYLTLGAILARFVAARRLKVYVLAIAVLLSFIVGVSRVYLGVHYPTDVLAGWTAGLLWAIICWLAARGLQRRGAVERPSKTPGEQS
jgi:undecaprenyl-diphosphatase